MLEIQQQREIIDQIGIEEWSAGHYSISQKGDIVCTPHGKKAPGVSLPEVIAEAKKRGLSTPMIIRFPQLIKTQIQRMHSA